MSQLNRDPRWGRNGETASEDPWFNGLYGAAYAEGAQYDPSEPGVLKSIVTLKHWGAYSVDLYKNSTGAWYRQSFDAQVSPFDMGTPMRLFLRVPCVATMALLLRTARSTVVRLV